MPDRVDWLLIGTGDIVKKRVGPALATANRSRLVGVCGGRERAAAIAAAHGASEVFDSVEEALRKTSAGAVYVATAVDRHAAEAVAALASGRPVLVEKPLGLSGADARQIVEAAAEAKLPAGCAYYRRFYPRFAHAKQLLASGALGRILSVRMSCSSWFNPASDDPKLWRVSRAKSGGGPLADMGSHMIDVLIGLFGTPGSAFAKVRTLVQGYEVEDSADFMLTLPGDVAVTASFHWASKSWGHDMEIIGSEGRLIWSPYDTGKVVTVIGRERKEEDLPNAANVHVPLVEDFVGAVLEKRAPAVTAAEAARTNAVLDAIYRSGEVGKEVAL